jgi:hypothetical protein
VEKLLKGRVSWQVFLLIMVNLRVLAPDSFLISKIIRYKMSFFLCSSLDLQSQMDLEANDFWEWKVAELAQSRV